MRQLIVLITLAIIAIPQISYAEDEVIWESEKISYLHDIKVAPQGDIFYNIKGKDIQIRRIDDGMLLDSIIMEDIPNYLYQLSISADGRYMALIGDNPYVIIYDLVERREVKRITVVVTDHDIYDKDTTLYTVDWATVSISPDGKRIVGVARTDKNSLQTNLVVVDIESEVVIFEDRRESLYDTQKNPTGGYFNWITGELTPDGNYVVAHLEFREVGNANAPDTIYVYDAHTFEIYDKLTTSLSNSKRMNISSNRPMFNYYNNNHIYIYDIKNRKSISTDLKVPITSIVYSRNSDQVVYAFDFDNHIYDINTKEVIYEYENPKLVRDISIDNGTMISTLNGTIYGMKTYFTTTSVEDYTDEIVISPNPTNGIVNINTSCIEPIINYQINNNSGLFIEEGVIDNMNGNIQINFSAFPVGVYFLTFQCNDLNPTYKIIKEG